MSLFPQPESNNLGSVAGALDALGNVEDESTANDAHDTFLRVMGDNHAEASCPFVLGFLPEIEQILMHGNAWAQKAVMEALIDLGGPFVPQEGQENYLGASVQETLRASIFSMRRHVAPLASGIDARARSAADLLELIDDRTA